MNPWPTWQDLLTGKMMGIGRERGGLYHLDIHSFKHMKMKSIGSLFPFIPCCNTLNFQHSNIVSNSVSHDIWHQSLEHMSQSRITLLPFLSKPVSLTHCTVCPQSKQCRLQFPNMSSSKSSGLFGLIHMDIWDPFHTPTYNGERYFCDNC